ncbi:flagellar biosynthesis protein FlgN [Buchnera aphidicola (Melanaphis sacchari)]|uniref:Flagellar biosynthesis protein FlgN n=1 Tax=Buchnera aphidicola (Melanaphis sacchari) TaxID=2173854 RepID=A0A2U8DF69_9GAMM|nr:flagellar biosynthesis protein FlgN [Buchnera aphidicola]AWH90459.1 flagellar biosynthesis protein FlgN [Buchnera aphidicola (Melanaphis sacchari)]
MKNLLVNLRIIKNTLIILENLINKEYICLLESETDIKKLNLITEEKHFYLKKFIYLKKKQSSLEEKYNISPPYLKFFKMNNYWNWIFKKSLFLNKINLKNKILLNQKFYLNQRFLNILKSHRENLTFGISEI